MSPYSIEAFGEIVIPKDWLFYTPLAMRLAKAQNEDALQDLVNIILRVRRSTAYRYHAILGDREAPNMAGKIRHLRGPL